MIAKDDGEGTLIGEIGGTVAPATLVCSLPFAIEYVYGAVLVFLKIVSRWCQAMAA